MTVNMTERKFNLDVFHALHRLFFNASIEIIFPGIFSNCCNQIRILIDKCNLGYA